MTPLLDTIALRSPYKNYHPTEKIVLTLICIYSILLTTSPFILGSYILLLFIFIYFKGRVPINKLGKMLLIPLPFISISCLSLLYSIDWGDGIQLRFLQSHIEPTSRIFLRNIGSILCLYTLMATTPLHHLLQGLETMRCPKVLIELVIIVYKYVFLFIDIASKTFAAQNARWGYTTYTKGLSSFSLLVSNLFIKSMNQGHQLFRHLEARGYKGTLHSISTFNKVNVIRITMVASICFCITLLDLLLLKL